MSKEQEIDEMLNNACINCTYLMVCDDHELKKACRMATMAKILYNAGYRKRNKGEWIKHFASYECTACNCEFSVSEYAEDYDPITDYDLKFCPNCGAYMKGGDNE